MRRLLLLTGLLALLAVPALAQDGTPEVTPEATPQVQTRITEPGVYALQFQYDGLMRTLRLDVPDSYFDSDEPAPLVFALHGAGGNGADFMTYDGWDSVGEAERVLVVDPDAVDGMWADGRPGVPADDAGMLVNATDLLSGVLNIDPERVFVMGYSAGGMMALRAACLYPDHFAGAASVASTMPQYILQECDAAPPLPVLFMVGTDDFVIPWMGARATYLDANNSAVYWAQHNGCQTEGSLDALPDADPSDRTRVIRSGYSDCTDGADVLLYGVYGGGHTYPGGLFPGSFGAGNTSLDIHAADEIWAFFDRVS